MSDDFTGRTKSSGIYFPPPGDGSFHGAFWLGCGAQSFGHCRRRLSFRCHLDGGLPPTPALSTLLIVFVSLWSPRTDTSLESFRAAQPQALDPDLPVPCSGGKPPCTVLSPGTVILGGSF